MNSRHYLIRVIRLIRLQAMTETEFRAIGVDHGQADPLDVQEDAPDLWVSLGQLSFMSTKLSKLQPWHVECAYRKEAEKKLG